MTTARDTVYSEQSIRCDNTSLHLDIVQQSLFVPYGNGALHLRHIAPVTARVDLSPVLMLHGTMSNGKVFYTESGRGLGCFLARQGFNVYVLDTSGRGLSTPKIAKGVDPGQGLVIREQLPLVHQLIVSRHPGKRLNWCAHSWGGVLMASCLVRFGELQSQVQSLLTFGSKRTIRVGSVKKWAMVDLLWNRIAPAIAKSRGFLPADALRLGMDNESCASLRECIDWVRGDWIDHDDGFDYAKAASAQGLPSAWFIAGARDTVLGNPRDVKDMMSECQASHARFTLLSRANGFLHDYDHGDMLTHSDAPLDHFPAVVSWLAEFDKERLSQRD